MVVGTTPSAPRERGGNRPTNVALTTGEQLEGHERTGLSSRRREPVPFPTWDNRRAWAVPGSLFAVTAQHREQVVQVVVRGLVAALVRSRVAHEVRLGTLEGPPGG